MSMLAFERTLPPRRLGLAIATIGGIGFIRRGPATIGALLGCGAFLFARPDRCQRYALAAAAALLGQLSVFRLVGDSGLDPQHIIIDEVAGVWLALAAAPDDTLTWVAATIIFRFLDKRKPGLIGLLDRRGGVFNVMGDDLVAGLLGGQLVSVGSRAVKTRA
jgi:phosphatidylglycerophosphatase A